MGGIPIRKTARKGHAISANTAIPQSFDRDAAALLAITAQPNPLYVRDGAQVFARTIIGDENAPNTTAPAAAAIFGAAEGHGEVCWHMQLSAGQVCHVGVYERVEVAPGVNRWLLVEEVGAVTGDVEYRHRARYRAIFFRCHTTANINAGAPATLRATGV